MGDILEILYGLYVCSGFENLCVLFFKLLWDFCDGGGLDSFWNLFLMMMFDFYDVSDFEVLCGLFLSVWLSLLGCLL